jgi:hypothetical protein
LCTALGYNGPKRLSTPSNGTVSQQPFKVASNSATLPSNFATAPYQQEKISAKTKLGTITCVQCATNLRSATSHYLFQCTAVSRQRWRNKTTSTLCKRLDATTDPKLSDIMTAGLCSYFQSKPLDCSEFEKYNAPYHNLIRLQESISWGHFLRGKISKEWANLQQDYIYRTSPGTKFDKDKWLRLIIKPLIMDCLDLWTLQNAERHGNDSTSEQQKLANQAQRDLRAIYQLQDEVLASDRDLFLTPLDTILLADTYSIQCWIRSHKPIIYQSRREAKRHAVTNVRLLSNLLSSTSKPENPTRPTYSPNPFHTPATPLHQNVRSLQSCTLHSRNHSKIYPQKSNPHTPLPATPAHLSRRPHVITNLTFLVGLPYCLRCRQDSHIT